MNARPQRGSAAPRVVEDDLTRRYLPLLVGVFLFCAASSLLVSAVGLQTLQRGWPPSLIGFVVAGFAVGGVLGAWVCESIILRVGHIRAFAAFSALLACFALAHLATTSLWMWVVLRVLVGACFYGLLLVVESWLNDGVDSRSRDRVLAVYMIVYFSSTAAGQALLALGISDAMALMPLCGALFSASVVPVVLARCPEPARLGGGRMTLRGMWRISGLAVLGSFAAGAGVGLFYGMGAVFGSSTGLGRGQVAALMASAILGGLVLQHPIGRLSDALHRPRVISIGAACAMALTLLAWSAWPIHGWPLYVGAAVFGGVMFALYPLCLAQANDHADHDAVVPLSRGLLSVFALGALGAPMLGGVLWRHYGPEVLLLEIALAMVPVCLLGMGARRLPVMFKSRYVFVPTSSLQASSIDPRQALEWVRRRLGRARVKRSERIRHLRRERQGDDMVKRRRERAD